MDGFFPLKLIKCRRRQTTDPQKLKKLSPVIFSFFLLVEAAAVDEITASTSLVSLHAKRTKTFEQKSIRKICGQNRMK